MRLAHVKPNDNSSPRVAVHSVLIGEHYLCQLYCSVYKSCSSGGLQAEVKICFSLMYSIERSQISVVREFKV